MQIMEASCANESKNRLNHHFTISFQKDSETKNMAVNNTFYFLKVELGIDTCEEVAAVERTRHGPEILWFWIRLALKYQKTSQVDS